MITNGTTAIIEQIDKRLTQLTSDVKEAEWDLSVKRQAECAARDQLDGLRKEQTTLKRALAELKGEKPQ